MSSYYDRYLQKVSEGRIDNAIELSSTVARETAAIEHGILTSIPSMTDHELDQFVIQGIEQAQQSPVTQWDLIRSQQAQRLAFQRVVLDLRAIIWVVVGVFFGCAIGFFAAAAIYQGRVNCPINYGARP